MSTNTRTIHTGFYTNKAKEVIDSVFGQLSDGMWENSRAAEKYWRFATTDVADDGEIVVNISTDSWKGYDRDWVRNGFYDMTEKQVLEFIAHKMKAVAIQELKDAINEYEAGQAQLAEANAKIAAAEQEIADGKAQLAEAKVQLDKGKAQLDEAKAQLDSGRAQLADAKNQLSAGQAKLNDNVDKMNDLKDQLTKYDDAESAVTTGIATLMEIEGIADRVSDESDYESVLEAAKEYAEEDAEKLTQELDVRKSLNSVLRLLSLAGILAGAVGLVAALRPNGKKLLAALIASGVTAAGAVAANIYGFTNDYMYFVYALSDGSGDGSLQSRAMIILLIVSLIAAVIAAVCAKAYKRALLASDDAAEPVNVRREDTVDNDIYDDFDDEDEEDDAEPAVRSKTAKPHRSAAPEDIGELEEMTRRLNEETERLESEARQKEYETARREYEEALKKFDEARKKAGQ